MHGFTAWLHQLQFGWLSDMLLIVLASLLCITIHETCHGLAAYRLGDPTAKLAGRLTLNPLRHIDILGLLMMAVARFGWAKPVPINMNNFKNPKRDMALTALAGPISNILLAWAALVVRGLLMVLLLAGWLDGPLYYLRTGLLNLLQPLALWPAELLLR